TASLSVPGAAEQDRTATVCARTADGYVAPVMWAGPLTGFNLATPVIPLYAIPASSKYLQFNYASEFTDGSSMYFVNSQVYKQVPTAPAYSFTPRNLAKVTVEEKTGTTEGSLGDWEIGPGSSCHDYGFDLSPGAPASRLTQYVSAGRWDVSYLP